jgi:tRNA(Phe) wybutosine-synthesizing methylase Tyw3
MKGSEKIELPILKNGKMLLNDYYLKILLQESNKKLERTWKKIQNLSELL